MTKESKDIPIVLNVQFQNIWMDAIPKHPEHHLSTMSIDKNHHQLTAKSTFIWEDTCGNAFNLIQQQLMSIPGPWQGRDKWTMMQNPS